MDTKTFTVELVTDMLGTVPMDPEVYKTYIESKKPEAAEGEEEYLTIEKMEQKGWTGFHSDKKGLFVYDYFIKGFFKHAGDVLREELKLKNLKSKIDDYLFVTPRRVYLGTKKADGVLERPLRGMTPRGPRVSLAKSDFIKEGTRIKFAVTLLPHKELNWDVVNRLIAHGELMGFGQFRNGGYGRFVVVK
jgi:hypothetical protein